MANELKTTTEYSKLRGGISLQAISQAIKLGWKMPGVVKIRKIGRFYLLLVQLDKNGKLKK